MEIETDMDYVRSRVITAMCKIKNSKSSSTIVAVDNAKLTLDMLAKRCSDEDLYAQLLCVLSNLSNLSNWRGSEIRGIIVWAIAKIKQEVI